MILWNASYHTLTLNANGPALQVGNVPEIYVLVTPTKTFMSRQPVRHLLFYKIPFFQQSLILLKHFYVCVVQKSTCWNSHKER